MSTEARPRTALWLRTLVFTLLFPGTVLVYLPCALLWLAGESRHPLLEPSGLLGWPLLALGVAGYLVCALRFGREGRGTPAPWDAPASLVAGGLYRWVRNPMYGALILALLGEALTFRSAALLSYTALVWLVFHLRVVRWEEPTLQCLFGEPYARYRERVPRWLPRRPSAPEQP